MPDKEGRRCLFYVKTPGRTYEMSAPDQKQRVEWIQGECLRLNLCQYFLKTCLQRSIVMTPKPAQLVWLRLARRELKVKALTQP